MSNFRKALMSTAIPIVVLSLIGLAGLLAAITGFYFGGKAAEKKTDET